MKKTISKYTYFFTSKTNINLVYCSRTNSILKLSPELYNFLLKCSNNTALINSLHKDVTSMLTHHKIIVSQKEDEDYLLERKFKEYLLSFSETTLGLILVPTTSCNFDCYYCFEENKASVFVDEQTIDNLIKFINTHTQAKNISLMWYGGEPLLAFEKIKIILERIKNETKLPIKHQSIVTNGYYFENKVIDFFSENKLNSIQITLDGDKSRHDTIRKLKHNGKGSYDIIMKNIDNILDKMPDTKVSIRINIDKANKDIFFQLQSTLSQRWKNKNVNIYPGILRIDNMSGTNLSCDVLNYQDIAELTYELQINDNASTSIAPELNYSKGCCATRVNSYIIGHKGEIYKCWNNVGNNDKIIGNINSNRLSNPILLYRYVIGSNILNSDKCINCPILPICPGTCPDYQLKNFYNNGEYELCECIYKNKKKLEAFLENYYLKSINNK